MTRVILLALISMAMLVIAPLVGASNSLTLESARLGSDSIDNRKGFFEDIFGGGDDDNDDEDEREDYENDREAEENNRDDDDDEDEFRRRDDFGRESNNDDNDDDEDDFSFDELDSREERIERTQRRGGGNNPYGEGNPRGGGQYEWR